mmetsp:Transcript_34726/g.99721  ORF Transcript_34726/g.99721 Transcript_34726/m.99721 type:complete len:252 (+) Transcript_34726:275-1030(+)
MLSSRFAGSFLFLAGRRLLFLARRNGNVALNARWRGRTPWVGGPSRLCRSGRGAGRRRQRLQLHKETHGVSHGLAREGPAPRGALGGLHAAQGPLLSRLRVPLNHLGEVYLIQPRFRSKPDRDGLNAFRVRLLDLQAHIRLVGYPLARLGGRLPLPAAAAAVGSGHAPRQHQRLEGACVEEPSKVLLVLVALPDLHCILVAEAPLLGPAPGALAHKHAQVLSDDVLRCGTLWQSPQRDVLPRWCVASCRIS